MMPQKMNWDDQLKIGNQMIDDDHGKILKIYNNLVDISQGIGYFDEFARVLSDMTIYALQHFEKEEAYMKQFNYPKLEQHIEIHRNYIYKVAMFNVNYRVATEVDEVLEFIKNWWFGHIQGADMEYEKYRLENHNNVEY